MKQPWHTKHSENILLKMVALKSGHAPFSIKNMAAVKTGGMITATEPTETKSGIGGL